MRNNKLIGTDPNQVPSNADLGSLAYVDSDNAGEVTVSYLTAKSYTGTPTKIEMSPGGVDARIIATNGDGGVGKIHWDQGGGGRWEFRSGGVDANTGLSTGSTTRLDIYYDGQIVMRNDAELRFGGYDGTLVLNANGTFQDTQTRHSVAPSLLLDFANSRELDSRIRFKRDSIATQYDVNGNIITVNANQPRFDYDPVTHESKGLLIEEERTNLLTSTRNPELWGLTSYTNPMNGVSSSILAPDGTYSASKLYIRGTDPYWYQNNLSLSAGTYVFTYWIKAFGSAVGKAFSDRINNTSGDGGGNRFTTLPSEWTRMTRTFTTSTVSNAYIGVEAPDTGTFTPGEYISIWGAQLEQGRFATSYIPSKDEFSGRGSEATYWDKDGVLRTASSNEARYGYKYNGRKWVYAGLILEKESTNKVDAAGAYGAYNFDIVDGIGPDGGYAFRTNGMAFDFHDSVSQENTTSFYAKKNNNRYLHISWSGVGPNNGSIGGVTNNNSWAIWDFDNKEFSYVGSQISSDGGWEVEDCDGWYRFSFTHTNGPTYSSGSVIIAASNVAVPVNSTYDWSSTNSVYVWGGQHEYGRVPTSYIYTDYPDDNSSVTRSADNFYSYPTTRKEDVVEMYDLSWYNPNESTIYGEATSITENNDVGSNPSLFGITDGTSNNRFLIRRFDNDSASDPNYAGWTFRLQIHDGTSTVINNDYFPAQGVLPEWDDDGIHKMALSISPGSQIGAADGIDAQMPSIDSPIYDTPDRVQIGNAGSSGCWNGHVRKLAYYPEQLSLAELIALTEID